MKRSSLTLIRRIPRPKPVDFPGLILDLRRHGWTMHAMAAAISVGYSAVKHWFYEGTAPKYDDGLALIELHRRVIAEAAEEKQAA